ncbi:Molybdopterin synthase sulfur carrier subunit [Caenorhabditis elegans]|uniref:Molybdopterin synthase sulfur carrier subunit n=1 Tax=Caenorhabditis elegans TaxID=6239 RepID=MOC2A_CAEEL|nr:Molybdopterin synthase sulfur carrier subunit [Caenorhabditis elegans]Q09412.1 RecName: Full=Molybdopterin synthase sulfur carrier subunit; AltName: Full=Molybdenum cofactor synthesis protein 2 small subunit; AltName: Full=Molybdenum cofactor synthesis protein 2A; Short=MOCS2A; AltName: Full=Sulfur carrier protein MOCS2A [Caenorhabditis elegans]CCD72862.1 Molybdopterin synthase sulfur carrier subunit [Caenorhabditis elegans]|eukprot:NP_498102.1 Molybdopterin synthase sulfur carrier subunit [Caenorhabditis elegans]
MISIKVLFFGEACQLVGKREEAIDFPEETDYEEIRKTILENYPALQKIEKVMMLAVDQEYANPGDRFELVRFTEIAVIPPLSGG